MEIISLHGTEDKLYELVARLVMDPDIIRQNNNYPFKTSSQYRWHLCLSEGVVVGFMPVKIGPGGLYIDNYYIKEDMREVLDALVTDILSTSSDKVVTVLSHKRHTDMFSQHGFITRTVFAQYSKMYHATEKGEGCR